MINSLFFSGSISTITSITTTTATTTVSTSTTSTTTATTATTTTGIPRTLVPNQWSQLSVSGSTPAGRTSHSNVYYNNSMYVFGGYSGVSYLNDTNSLNLSTLAWTSVTTTGVAPAIRYGHVSVLDTGNRMYVYGGSSDGANTTFSDVNRLDLTTNVWSGTLSCTGTSPPGNTGRVWSSAVIYNNNMYVFGGWIGTDSRNDVYKLDLSTLVWSSVTTSGTPPAKRYGQSSIIDTSFNMYVFGGWGAARYNDVYKLDLSTLVWTAITTTGTPPAIRYFHSAIYSNDNKMYVFGGQEGGTFYRDVNCLDLTTLAWTQPVISGIPPIERGQHSALLSDASNMYIYAGNYGDVYDDVHKLGA